MEFPSEGECKVILCVLPTQQGKTFTAIGHIDVEMAQDDEYGRSIHFVFTMNTLLNNKQFAARLAAIERAHGRGSVCVFASKYNGTYTHVTDRLQLQGLCVDAATCPRVVVMCSNKARYDDGVAFLKVIDQNRICVHRAFAYYDELHMYISDSLRAQIEAINALEIVRGIMALTATPDKIFARDGGFWSTLRLIELDELNDRNYAGCDDMIFHCVDDFHSFPYTRPKTFDELDEQTVGYVAHILRANPHILRDGTTTFIPAHRRRVGHNQVRDLVFSTNNNAVVAVINGSEKTLQYQDASGQTITAELTSNHEEVCETICRVLTTHGLTTRPVVITGFLCVGMGQTLTHKSRGSFTSAILGHLDLTNDDLYQLFGRVTGRTKDWGDKYTPTQVYCPTPVMNRCRVMEECSRNMARAHNGEVVSQDDYREPMTVMGAAGASAIENLRKAKSVSTKRNTYDSDREHRVFASQDDAIAFAKTLGVKLNRRKDSDAPKELRKDGKNLSSAALFARMWGLSDQTILRMIPTCDNEWCVYWRPSTIKARGHGMNGPTST